MQTKLKSTEERLLATVLRDVLRTEGFETLADLIDALKVRCHQLDIAYTNDSLNEAIRLVGSNHLLPPYPPRPRPIERLDSYRGPNRQDAAKALKMIIDEIRAAEARCDALEAEAKEQR